MFAIWSIARRDLLHFFTTPLAWLVLAVWCALVNWIFYWTGLEAARSTGGSLDPLFVGSLHAGATFLIFLAPALTMGAFAHERSLGTLPLLFTVPVRDAQLILGKFLASWLMLLSLLAATLPQYVVLALVSDPGGAQLASGLLGLVLLCAFMAALGNWISLLVDAPVAAYVITFGVLVVFQLLALIGGEHASPLAPLGQALGLQQRVSAFIAGDIQAGHALWLIGGSTLWLILAHGSLQARRRHG